MVECSLNGVSISNRHNGFDRGGDILPSRISVVRIFSLWCWDLVVRTFSVRDNSFCQVIVHHDPLRPAKKT